MRLLWHASCQSINWSLALHVQPLSLQVLRTKNPQSVSLMVAFLSCSETKNESGQAWRMPHEDDEFQINRCSNGFRGDWIGKSYQNSILGRTIMIEVMINRFVCHLSGLFAYEPSLSCESCLKLIGSRFPASGQFLAQPEAELFFTSVHTCCIHLA